MSTGVLEQVVSGTPKPQLVLMKAIENGLKSLNSIQISIIKNGIEQHGAIGHYGRSFISSAILKYWAAQ